LIVEMIGPTAPNWKRLRWLVLALAFAVAYGVAGYIVFERWSLADSLYMTLLVLSTVGFREVRPLDASGRVFTASLIVVGVALVLVTVTMVAMWVAESNLGLARRKRQMQKRIDALRDHFIVCAYGRVGRAVARELENQGVPFIVLDTKEELEERMLADEVTYLIANPAQEGVLRQAGIDRARGLICAVDDDAINVYITLMARRVNPDIFIVARGSEPGSDENLENAGADRVVSPFLSSGRHMAVIGLRPNITDVLELTEQRSGTAIVEEVFVEEGSSLDGRTVAEATGTATAIALRTADGAVTPGPTSDRKLAAGDLLILLGEEPQHRNG
jgi:voltage-gated potassium channel